MNDDAKKNRREMLLGGLGLAGAVMAGTGGGHAKAAGRSGTFSLSAFLDGTAFGLKPNGRRNQSAQMQKAINKAAKSGRILFLPAGKYKVGDLKLPSHTVMAGVPGRTYLSLTGARTLLQGKDARNIHLTHLVLEGNGLRGREGLVSFHKVRELHIEHCRFQNFVGNGVHLEKSGGRVVANEVRHITETGLFSQNARGLEIAHNHVHDCHNNGIQVWRSKPGHDGTLVTMNRIETIRADRGGQGPYGNAINLYQADDVLVSGNQIQECRFSAIRNNASSNCQIVQNHCRRLGEVAIYVEFAFQGAIVANNLVDGAGSGIVVTNFKEGGRLATVQGNLVRNITGRANEGGYGPGIAVEADSVVSGNVVEGVKDDGILVGWGQYVRDVIVTGNLLRNCQAGIGITGHERGGNLSVNNNMISQVRKGAIRVKLYDDYTGPDLVRKGTDKYKNFAIYSNVASG